MTAHPGTRTTTSTTAKAAVALVGASLTGIAAGALTAYLQGVLSADWNTIANSGAVWTVAAFAAALAFGRTRFVAALAATLVLVGEVAGYYAYVADVRHLPMLHTAELLWTLAALWIGPLAGLAAWAVRWGRPDQRTVALAALAGVVAGEGLYLIRVAAVPRSGWVEVGLAVIGAAVTLLALPAAVRARLTALSAGVLVTAAVYLAYSQPLIA